MRSRWKRGFTLLELLVAIVLAGIVALLVYGTASAGRDTEVRLRERRRALQAAQAFRSTVADALRNARPTRIYGDTAFWMDGQRVSFVTAGSMPPLTPDADWEVGIAARPDGRGVEMTAKPVGIALPPRVVAQYPEATGLRIRVLTFGPSPVWTDRWAFTSYVPAAIELTYLRHDGLLGAPLRLALPLGSPQ